MVNEKRSTCYCINLRRSAGIVTDIYDEALQPYGLTIAQYCLLVHLKRMNSANITQWAERVGLERSTMVRNVRVLEKNGWIQTTAGRGKCYILTDTGDSSLTEVIPVWERTQRKIELCLGAEDAESLLRIAEKLQNIYK